MSRPGWLLRALGSLPNTPKSPSGSDEPPGPVTRPRIADYLRDRGYRFVVDEDGDLTGTWDGNRFWFLLLGDAQEILQVRGRWHRTLPLDARGALALALNDWNRERIWPKAYVREEEGALAVYAETSADLEAGANDVQFAQLLSCGLGTGVQMFSTFESQMPEPGTEDPTDLPDH